MKFRLLILIAVFFVVLMTSLSSQNIYLLVLLSFACFLLIPFNKYWDSIAAALIIFSLFYTIMIILKGEVKSGFTTISYLVSPVSFYRLGRYFMDMITAEKSRLRFFLFMALAYLLNVFILTFIDVSIVGVVNEDRVLLAHSATDDALAATLYGLMASVGIGCFGGVMGKNIRFTTRVAYVLLVLTSIFSVVHLVNRTGLVVSLVCIFVTLCYRENFKFNKIILYVLLCAIIGVGLFFSEVIDPDIIDAYQKRELDTTMGLTTAGGRTELWFKALGDLIVSPLGWEQEGYAHNMWLDMARVSGWFALVPFLIATFIYLSQLCKLVRMNFSNVAQILISMNLSMFLAAFVEPVIEGSILFFSILMFIWGITSNICRQEQISR